MWDDIQEMLDEENDYDDTQDIMRELYPDPEYDFDDDSDDDF